MSPSALARAMHGASETAETPVFSLRFLAAEAGDGRIANVVMAVVEKAEVARAKVVVDIEEFQIAADGIAVLNADQRRAPALRRAGAARPQR